ncbi:amino acid ABC transporter permease [Candidatus Villigracilis affinis]|uniref:amino acid ABC transporter permease n=1 Tax=Candidatus Villigracilis affinis TaxID=3140682 RepID=UPI0031E937CB
MTAFFEFFVRFLPDMLKGAGVTVLLTAEGLAAGFVLGLLASLARTYGNKFWRGVAVSYIELFRGTPLLMQLFLIYYGLPGLGVTFSRELSAFLALGLNSGAYQAEYLRGSILAIGDGQMMAGRSIGMSRIKTIWHIILPQALRLAIPAWSNEPVSLLKSTAVVFLIAVPGVDGKSKIHRRSDL